LSAVSVPPSDHFAAPFCPHIEGAAVTAVRIEGFLHEFQSTLVFCGRRHRHHPQPQADSFKLQAMAQGSLPSALTQPCFNLRSIEADGDVEILDKNVYICTVPKRKTTWRCA